MKPIKAIPILRIFDYQKAKEFYVEWLGAEILWEHTYGENFPVYMELSLHGLILHLSEHHGDCSPGAKVSIECTELAEYHKSLRDVDYKYNKPGIGKVPWGGNAIGMEVIDPFGNKLYFVETIKETKT